MNFLQKIMCDNIQIKTINFENRKSKNNIKLWFLVVICESDEKNFCKQ